MKDAPVETPRAWPAAQVEMWQAADLVPYAKNARQHPPEQIDQIAASMERFGFTIPMLVAEDGTIIAGHGRLMAAVQLGLAEVPVMVARGWSEEDRRLYTLADNRLEEIAEWDPEMLRIEIGEALLRKGLLRDSSRESSVVAGLHEQTDPAELQDQELAGLQ